MHIRCLFGGHRGFRIVLRVAILCSSSRRALCFSKSVEDCKTQVRSGKTDPVQFKWVFKQGPFCIKKWAFCKQMSPLRYRTFRSLEKGKCVFQKSLSETPFKPDRVSFRTPNQDPKSTPHPHRLTILHVILGEGCEYLLSFPLGE